MQFVNKEIVRDCFQKNFNTYEKYAVVQKKIASTLINQLKNYCDNKLQNVLEIGSGTGFLTEKVLKSFEVKEYAINDLTNELPETINTLIKKRSFTNFNHLPGDAEKIEFPKLQDALFSTSTFQWFQNLEAFIEKVSGILKTKGLLAFSTFGKGNFTEIKSLLNIGLNYKSLDEIINILKPYFDIINTSEWKQVEVFKSPKEVLKHFKQTGVNGVQNCFFGKERYLNYHEQYLNNFSNEDGTVNLTYHPIIIIAKKKN